MRPSRVILLAEPVRDRRSIGPLTDVLLQSHPQQHVRLHSVGNLDEDPAPHAGLWDLGEDLLQQGGWVVAARPSRDFVGTARPREVRRFTG